MKISRKLTKPTHYNVIISLTPVAFVAATARWAQNGVTAAGGNGEGDERNQLNSPAGLFVDEKDTVVVAGWGNHRIMQWKRDDTRGTVLAGGNRQGNRPSQLDHPTDVIFDKVTSSLIIADRGNRRVTRWSLLSGNRTGETIIDNIDCRGLAMDDKGSLYVTDYVKHEVKRYCRGATSGTVVAGGNGQGTGLHQLNNPFYVCVDEEHTVYVSDNDNHRVMKWKNGAKEGIVVAGGRGGGEDLTQLSYPRGVRVDAAGNIYVADWGNERVMRWCRGATQGTVLVDGNGKGEGANHFNGPASLSFDRHGHLYVTDIGNHRVQRFLLEKN